MDHNAYSCAWQLSEFLKLVRAKYIYLNVTQERISNAVRDTGQRNCCEYPYAFEVLSHDYHDELSIGGTVWLRVVVILAGWKSGVRAAKELYIIQTPRLCAHCHSKRNTKKIKRDSAEGHSAQIPTSTGGLSRGSHFKPLDSPSAHVCVFWASSPTIGTFPSKTSPVLGSIVTDVSGGSLCSK